MVSGLECVSSSPLWMRKTQEAVTAAEVVQSGQAILLHLVNYKYH